MTSARRQPVVPSSKELEESLLSDVRGLLARWQLEDAGRPRREREHLLLLALEREQIVAVAYREEAVAGRVAALEIDDAARDVIRQTLVWIWKDEQLHAEYLRGELLHAGGLGSSLIVYGRQVQGALSGWTTATANHREARTAPIRTGAAGALVAVAGALNRIPPALQRELRYQSFHRYCELNVALEASAELAYRRLVDLSTTEEERSTFEQIRADEERHTRAFRVLSRVLTADDRLVAGGSSDLITELSEISPWFIPAALRAPVARHGAHRSFASRQPVAARSGKTDDDKIATLEDALDQAGLAAIASRASRAALRVSFMLGYDRRDRSNVNNPELVEAVARYLRRHGVEDVAVLEAPTVYATSFANRSVEFVASYFGYSSASYRIVDIGQDLRPFTFERGFVQQAISATWQDADLRIVMPKLRTDPTEFAHLSLSTLEGSTGAIDETFYAGRRTDFRSATMMLLDVAPPDFAIVDGWSPVADGPFGVMACHRPAPVRHIYAGADALTVDEVVLADLGIADARRAPIVRQAYHWFGLEPAPTQVDGSRPDLNAELRGADRSALLRGLGMISYPVYVYLSRDGVALRPRHGHVVVSSARTRRSRHPCCPVGCPAGVRSPPPRLLT